MDYKKLLEIENEIYSIDELFDELLISTIYDYNLKNYMAIKNYDKWAPLSEEEKLEYCYIFFDVVEKNEFPILKQVDIFTRLICLDFEKFSYVNVIECMFGNYDQMGTIHMEKIPYNPLIPQKHYLKYIKELKAKSNVGHLQIPTDDANEYFKEMLKLWFYYKHKNYTAYKIANEFYTLDDQKQISRNLHSIKKIYDAIQLKQL